MPNMKWSQLNHLQLGAFAEYFVKMELSSYGLDVFTTEVDDKGIDFVIKNNKGRYYDIQVKSTRQLNYVFMSKDKFNINQDNLFLALVIFEENHFPNVFLVPSSAWNNENDLLKGRDYSGLKSKPEWGLNLSHKNLHLLQKFEISNSIKSIL